jgi:hypothetical protein
VPYSFARGSTPLSKVISSAFGVFTFIGNTVSLHTYNMGPYMIMLVAWPGHFFYCVCLEVMYLMAGCHESKFSQHRLVAVANCFSA